MTNQTLGQMLKAEFGGEIEGEWGMPTEKYLAAYLNRVKKEPNKNEITNAITQYFANHGFKKMEGLGELNFEDLNNKKHRSACYTYSKGLQRLIVSAAKF